MSAAQFPTLGQSVPVYIYLIVLDPRHKMQYYKDNDFDDFYIETYKKQITELWTTEYKPKSNVSDNQSNTKQNALSAHMFRKRKIAYNDELEEYLNEPPIDFNMDVLTFWKVKLKLMILYIINNLFFKYQIFLDS